MKLHAKEHLKGGNPSDIGSISKSSQIPNPKHKKIENQSPMTILRYQ